jgi:uncharacterized membrane protein YphA (DoxX/SURF4 family)
MANSEFAAKENDVKIQSVSPPQVGTSPGSRRKLAELYVRLALGVAFLSAVADRFGLWGPYGHKNVDWGDFSHFVAYTARVNSFLPAAVIPAVAWIATVAETALGLCLILGIFRRVVALGSAALLLLFALSMAISFGLKSPLDYSVFAASAAAFLLFAIDQPAAAQAKG